MIVILNHKSTLLINIMYMSYNKKSMRIQVIPMLIYKFKVYVLVYFYKIFKIFKIIFFFNK